MTDSEATGMKAGGRHQSARRWSLGRFGKNRDGATAIEFAILAIPFFIIVFAALETFIAFTGDQLLANANDVMARKIRTGQIKAGSSETAFRQAFCDEISILLTCSDTEAATEDRLFIDVRSYANFSDIPAAVPRKDGDLDTGSMTFAPGGPETINIVRSYYRWSVTFDLVRPYITNLRPAGSSMPKDYLMVATTAFRNENFP